MPAITTGLIPNKPQVARGVCVEICVFTHYRKNDEIKSYNWVDA